MFNEVFLERSRALSNKVIEALCQRQFEAYFCENKYEALKKALSLLSPKSSISWGGSETIKQIGLIEEVKKGDWKVIDRDVEENREKKIELMRWALSCDFYLTSSNAVTEAGELVNIDGLGNRTAAMIFGPKNVLVIAGANKICANVKDAVSRVRNYAAPMNTARLKLKNTPCAVTGICGDCKSPECICSCIVTMRMCKVPNRIKVILVGESLGY
jgi:hypothetical protein